VRLSIVAALRSAGFTLIELMIAIAIFAILVMLAMPSFTEYLGNTQIRNATESILNGVRLAQTQAVKHNRHASFVLDTTASTGGWSVRDLDEDDVDIAPEVQSYSWSEGAPKVSVSRLPGTALRVTFNGVGRIDANPDASASLTRIDITNPTMSTPRALRVVIGVGAIKLCDPDAAIVAPDPMACP
jgi:type IV fimbrial biogenesis protein FimT